MFWKGGKNSSHLTSPTLRYNGIHFSLQGPKAYLPGLRLQPNGLRAALKRKGHREVELSTCMQQSPGILRQRGTAVEVLLECTMYL